MGVGPLTSMTLPGTYCVTPAEGEPYRVAVEPSPEGWTAVVERSGQRWSYRIVPGPDDRVWIADRLRSCRWEALDGSRGRLELDGEPFAMVVETETRHRTRRIRSAGGPAGRPVEVRAPIPGLVVIVETQAGARLESGAGIAIIEAMKMENEITAPVAGVVRDLAIAAGQTVEQGALLCRIEPGGENG